MEKRPNNLTALLVNGSKRWMALVWILIMHKRRPVMHHLSCSVLSLPMMRLFFSLMKSEEKIRLFLMRLRISWIKSVKAEDPFMILIKSASALEQEENKVLRAQLELTQLKQEIDRRMAEKDEEFAATKKNMTKAIESMQSAVETESKGKAEALRMKKKLETDVLDLDCNLEHANAANAETQRTIKNYQLSLREAQSKLEEQQRAKEHAHDELINAERKANSNQNALEESRTLLEQADRARRMVEQELADTNETLSEQTCTNQAIQGAKQKLEAEMSTLQADCDEMASEAALSEEKAQRAMIDAARLADELRAEQDMAQSLEREKKL